MKTTYKDYIPETANRKYKMTNNADGTVSLDDQTVYSQTGDKVTAAVLNELSQNVVWPLTHSKSGTTHALTGLSGASGILSCQFKATTPLRCRRHGDSGRDQLHHHSAFQRGGSRGQPFRVRRGGALYRGYGGVDGKF